MELEALVHTYPRLFHLAEADAWLGVKRHGLLSTEALLDLFEVGEPLRSGLLRERRNASITIKHSVHGSAVVRDNLPLSAAKLEACLTDMTVEDFLSHLNRHVFFWPSQQRLERLLKAAAYRSRRHLIIEVDTASLVRVHGESIRLSPINTGATLFNAPPRGSRTLVPVADFDFEYWRCKRTRPTAVAEVCVEYAVLDLIAHTSRAYVRAPDGTCEAIEVKR